MIIINIIDNRAMRRSLQKELSKVKMISDRGAQLAFWSVDTTVFKARRYANKVVNDYSVTELPFVLFVDDDGKEYAALYSEEAPLTMDRIMSKLNDI